MAVALEQKIGNGAVRIRDDYCKDKTPEDARKILRRIADYVQSEATAKSESPIPETESGN